MADLEREMALVIRAHWTTHSDTDLANLMARSWGVRVDRRRVIRLRKALGLIRPSDSVPRKRGRQRGGKMGPG